MYFRLLRVWNGLGEVGLKARVTDSAGAGDLVEQAQRGRPQREPADAAVRDGHGRVGQLLRCAGAGGGGLGAGFIAYFVLRRGGRGGGDMPRPDTFLLDALYFPRFVV